MDLKRCVSLRRKLWEITIDSEWPLCMQKLPLEGTSSITYYFHLDQDDHAKEIRLQNWAGQSCYGTFWNDFGEGKKKKVKFLFEQMKDKKLLIGTPKFWHGNLTFSYGFCPFNAYQVKDIHNCVLKAVHWPKNCTSV